MRGNINLGRVLHRFRYNCVAMWKIANFGYPTLV